jgi:dUTP pyrophosphatase
MTHTYLKYKKLNSLAITPTYADDGAVGLDLYAYYNVLLSPFEPTLIDSGIAIELPEGHEAQIRPRSSTLLKRGIHVALGTVDTSYRGPLGCVATWLDRDALDSWRDAYRVVKAGERIAQLVIAPIVKCILFEDTALSDTKRGTSGFGSSGL